MAVVYMHYCYLSFTDAYRLESLKKDEEQLSQELKETQKKLEDTKEAITLIDRDLKPL